MNIINLTAQNNESFVFSRVISDWAQFFNLDAGWFRAQMRYSAGTPVVLYEWSTRKGNVTYQKLPATGSVVFTANPVPGQTLTIGATLITFVASGATGNQVNIGSNLAETLGSLLTFLQTSTDSQIIKCAYALAGTALVVTFNTAGIAGNTFVLATTVSGATTGGLLLTVPAVGTVSFTVDPTPGQILTVGSTVITFVLSYATGNQVQIGGGGDLAATLNYFLLPFLQASTDSQISQCSYALSGSVLTVTFKEPGLAGNAFALTTNVGGATASGSLLTPTIGTLSGGAVVVEMTAPIKDVAQFSGAYVYDFQFNSNDHTVTVILFGGSLEFNQGITT